MLRDDSARFPVIFLSSIRKRRFLRSGMSPFPPLPCELLCIVQSGKGYLRIDHEVFPFSAGDAFFLTPSMLLQGRMESAHADCYLLRLQRLTVGKRSGSWAAADAANGETPTLLQPGKLPVKSPRALLELANRLHRDNASRAKPAGWLQLDFQSMLRSILDDLPDRAETKEEAGQGIDLSIQYMYKHYREKLKLDTLARIAGLTQTSYSRSFKKARGVSPVEYLNRIRIDSSRRLLDQQCPIKETAESVGFGNEFYFSRMFKREMGISPTMYVARKQLKVAVATCFLYQDNLQALGVDVVAAMNHHDGPDPGEPGARTYIAEQLQALRQAEPDLILADFQHVPFQEQLRQIAPTVALEYTMDWRRNHRRIAELVGREKEAQLNFDQLEMKVAYARRMLADTIGGETVSVLRLYETSIRIQGVVGHPLNELLYAELGLKPGNGAPLRVQNMTYPLAAMPPFESDRMFLIPCYPDRQEADVLAQLEDSGLPAGGMRKLRGGRIRFTDNWVRLSWTPVGRHRIVDELLALE
ncbi:AraC family transcriptional regulator [Paenibacillus cymbidii]|uniref:AraC family transcriptional regulator n=1 Tax=Paenibacillus cymbidii TaxID=1639034 RepID=UPI00108143ED|nr:helix-turn-helix domain-containing protein [Paenibacillus cymbidii]